MLDRRVLQTLTDVEKQAGARAAAQLMLLLCVDANNVSWAAHQVRACACVHACRCASACKVWLAWPRSGKRGGAGGLVGQPAVAVAAAWCVHRGAPGKCHCVRPRNAQCLQVLTRHYWGLTPEQVIIVPICR